MRAHSVVAISILLMAGCSEADDTVGGEVPQQFPSESFPGDRQRLEVRVDQAHNGCFMGSLTGDTTAEYLIVWPAGTEKGEHGDRLRLPDGTPVASDDVVVGPGVMMPSRHLEAIEEPSFWHHTVGFCDKGAKKVLVLDSATRR